MVDRYCAPVHFNFGTWVFSTLLTIKLDYSIRRLQVQYQINDFLFISSSINLKTKSLPKRVNKPKNLPWMNILDTTNKISTTWRPCLRTWNSHQRTWIACETWESLQKVLPASKRTRSIQIFRRKCTTILKGSTKCCSFH